MRNWCPGQAGEAGAFGRDEIRNITGAIINTDADPLTSMSKCTASGAIYYTGQRVSASGATVSSDGGYAELRFDASLSVATGPENVPPHVRHPVSIYLGTPK